jgi:hypothetical protein
MEGDPINTPYFDKTKRKGKEKEKVEKGCWRRGQNNATEVDAAMGAGANRGRGENGSDGKAEVNQAGNA